MVFYKHDSASGATSPKYEMIFKLWLRATTNLNPVFPDNAAMLTGRTVEMGVRRVEGLENFDPDKGKQDGMPVAEATRHMMADFDEYVPRDWDEGKDKEEHEAFREHLPDMLANALEGLKAWQNKHGLNTVNGEHVTWHSVPELDVRIMMFRDFYGGDVLCDLKCKMPQRNPLKKDGTRTWRIPKPDMQPSENNIKQMSVYWRATGQKPSLLQVTASGFHIWDEDNCPLLQEQHLEQVYQDVKRSWITTQNLIRAAQGNWHTLAGLVAPDFTEIAKKHGPHILKLAREFWK